MSTNVTSSTSNGQASASPFTARNLAQIQQASPAYQARKAAHEKHLAACAAYHATMKVRMDDLARYVHAISMPLAEDAATKGHGACPVFEFNVFLTPDLEKDMVYWNGFVKNIVKNPDGTDYIDPKTGLTVSDGTDYINPDTGLPVLAPITEKGSTPLATLILGKYDPVTKTHSFTDLPDGKPLAWHLARLVVPTADDPNFKPFGNLKPDGQPEYTFSTSAISRSGRCALYLNWGEPMPRTPKKHDKRDQHNKRDQYNKRDQTQQQPERPTISMTDYMQKMKDRASK